ncbi:PTS transporter subunit EIIC [Oribacterium sp. WCC10]|uniref:PTS transporter subunit EIIC n=1 Tax=Oribacterium sp. WCC10 TaxID=1855343 RepID=UPI0008EFA505|nr:PTS transporter subunit EIIC [Oribacterium sp. WCC10]SFG38180.1 PTS system, beta-glucosides-specific IIC component [Oribacterium sp. WCC10]
MAKDYELIAREVVKNVGGSDNIKELTHCVTRLRFILKDKSKADKEALESINGVLKVIEASGQTQVVIGQDVTKAFDAVMALPEAADWGKSSGTVSVEDTEEPEDIVAENKKKAKKNVFGDKFVEYVSAIFTPFMEAFMGAGLLKGFVVLFVTIGMLSKESSTYQILYSAADGVFYFLPVFIGYTAGKKFGAKPFLTMAIAAAMVYPNIVALKSAETAVTFMGIPVNMISYTSSVLPIIAAAYVQAKWEKLLKKFLPEVVAGIFIPLLDLLVIFPLTLIVVGPVTDYLGRGIAVMIELGLNTVPLLAGFLMAALWPVMIIFGVHWGLIPICMNNYAVLGYDYILPLTVGTNFGIAAATFAVFLRTRDKKLKELSGTSALSAFIGGVTEPAIYGVLLARKKVFAAMCIINGIGGALCAIMHVTRDVQISVNALTLPAIYAVYGPWGIVAIVISIVGAFTAAFVTFREDGDKKSIKVKSVTAQKASA